jgi:hypothetical protein
MYRLLLNVTIEMHTVGSSMGLSVVHIKDRTIIIPTTLKPARSEFLRIGVVEITFPGSWV